jgi:pentose-5-phosphate-3-epimerase
MKISASLHAADPLRLAEAVSAIRPYVESLHVDVMDGRFAPAFGFGERLVDSLVADGGLPIDVHLMVERPDDWQYVLRSSGSKCGFSYRGGGRTRATGLETLPSIRSGKHQCRELRPHL